MSPNNRTNGRRYMRALQHALAAAAKDREELAQIAFIGNEIVGARPRLMHVGVLPRDYSIARATVVTRKSAVAILETLRGYDRRTHGKFEISQDGLTLEIHVDDMTITDGYDEFDCRYVPTKWRDRWVCEMPSEQGIAPAIDSAIQKRALAAWKDNGKTRTVHGVVATDPVIIEVTDKNGEVLAYAWALPDGRPDAMLADDSPLFDGTKKEPRGRSVLEFSIAIVASSDATMGPPKVREGADGVRTIRVGAGGAYEIDVSDIPDAVVNTLPRDDVDAVNRIIGDYRTRQEAAAAGGDEEAAAPKPVTDAAAPRKRPGRPKKSESVN